MFWSEDELLKVLPHGSGIDADWKIRDNGVEFECKNEWHLLNEYGEYIGWFPFTVYVPYRKDELSQIVIEWDFEMDEIEDEEERDRLEATIDYLDDTIYHTLKDYLDRKKK